MAVSKVVVNTENGAETLIDLTNDTVAPESLAEGATAHDASGNVVVGTMPTTTVLYTKQNLNKAQKEQARQNIDALSSEGASAVYIGADTPPEGFDVWVDPDGEPTSTEDWEFDMDDGTTDTKTVVVVGAEEANGYTGILRVRQEDGTWTEIPALTGRKGDRGEAFTYEDFTPEQLASLKGEKGDPGYTPVKGKDYFDGYTPQKGVDYFDGGKGDNGIPATHSWNGTTLTVTSASGTSSADLKGDKGDTGESGVVTPVGGFYTLSVDADGNLWVTSEDGSTPDFEYDSESGNLYVKVDGLNVLIGNVKGEKGDPGESISIVSVGGNTLPGSDTIIEFSDGTQVAIKNGKDGKDGVDAVHAWNGTVLTVSSASGTSSADLKGDKGDPGSDANVTSANIAAALGYTPANNADLSKKADDYSLEINNNATGTGDVKFATVDYSTCDSNNGVSALVRMRSGHGNGKSFIFSQDVYIHVNYDGTVRVDNRKHYDSYAGKYDDVSHQYGDIFWVIDTDNKIVDFYCLVGQWTRLYMTPWKRIANSTKGTFTQHTDRILYSEGTKEWANNSVIVVKSDIPSWAMKSTKPSYTASEVGALSTSGGTLTGATIIDTASTSNEPTGTPALRILHAGMWDVGDLVDMAIFSVFPNSPFGLKFKADGNGQAYIQSQRIDSATEMFPLQLNPYGGAVYVNGLQVATKNDIPTNKETWTFTLEDGSTVTKSVYVG